MPPLRLNAPYVAHVPGDVHRIAAQHVREPPEDFLAEQLAVVCPFCLAAVRRGTPT